MKNKISIIILIILFANTIFAQEPQKTDSIYSFSITEAQEYAVENNIIIINKELDIKKAKWQIWETTAIGLPQVNGSAEYQQFPDVPTTLMPNFMTPVVVGINTQVFGLTPIVPISDETEMMEMQMGSEYNLNWGVTATQLIFSGEYIVGLQATRIFKELSKQSLEKSEIDLRATVAQSYYLVLIADQSLQILDSTYVNINSILYETEKMNEAGLIEQAQADQIKLTVLNIKNQIASLKRQAVFARRLLKYQLGLNLNDTVVLTDGLEQITDNSNFTALIMQEYNYQNNIDYKMMQTNEIITKLDMRRTQSSCLPTVSAFATYSEKAMRDEFNFTDTDEDWFPTSLFGFSLQVPIFSSGQRYAQIQQKKIELAKVRNQKTQLEIGLIIQYEEAKNNYITAYETFINQKENLQLSKNVYEDALIKYEKGTIGTLDLTQTQNQYLNSQSAYYQTLISLLNAKTELEKL